MSPYLSASPRNNAVSHENKQCWALKRNGNRKNGPVKEPRHITREIAKLRGLKQCSKCNNTTCSVCESYPQTLIR